MRKIAKSFGFAWDGLRATWREGLNFRVQVGITLVVIVLGIIADLSAVRWAIVLMAAGLVLFAEIINTAIEDLCDHVEPAQNETIGKVKDLSAAAVLVLAITAVLVAIFIFYPEFF